MRKINLQFEVVELPLTGKLKQSQRNKNYTFDDGNTLIIFMQNIINRLRI